MLLSAFTAHMKISKDKATLKECKKSDTHKDDKNFLSSDDKEEEYLNSVVTPTNELSDYVIIDDYPDISTEYTDKVDDTIYPQTDDGKSLNKGEVDVKQSPVLFCRAKREEVISSPSQDYENKHILQDWPDSQWVLIKSPRELSTVSSQAISEPTNYESFVKDLSSQITKVSEESIVPKKETSVFDQKHPNQKLSESALCSNHPESNLERTPQTSIIRKTSIPRLKSKSAQSNTNLPKSDSKAMAQKKKAIPTLSASAGVTASSIPRLSRKSSLGSSSLESNRTKCNKSLYQNRVNSNCNTVDKRDDEKGTPVSINSTKLRIYVPYYNQNITSTDVNKIKIKVKLPKPDDKVPNSYLPSIDS